MEVFTLPKITPINGGIKIKGNLSGLDLERIIRKFRDLFDCEPHLTLRGKWSEPGTWFVRDEPDTLKAVDLTKAKRGYPVTYSGRKFTTAVYGPRGENPQRRAHVKLDAGTEVEVRLYTEAKYEAHGS
jgi:hypothetical protein